MDSVGKGAPNDQAAGEHSDVALLRHRLTGLFFPGRAMKAERVPEFARAATVPSFVICGASPFFVPLFASIGLAGAGFVLHRALWVFAPLNLLVLWRGYTRHGRPAAVLLGALGTLSVWVHLLEHNFDRTVLPLIWAGVVLLLAASALDFAADRGYRRSLLTEAGVGEYWRAVLTGEHPGLRRGRRFFRILPGNPKCKLCNAPLGGPGAVISKLLGKSRSQKNPNFCGDCLAKTPLGGAEVVISMLFADIRGSTTMAEQTSPSEFAAALNRFYEAATRVLLKGDALVDRFVGDEAIGLFVPGYAGRDHARKAIRAAWQLLQALRDLNEPPGPGTTAAPGMGKGDLPNPGSGNRDSPPVGIGVHTGTAFVGIVGSQTGVTELAALGDAVNATARITAAAGPGEILVSAAAARAAGIDLTRFEERDLELKGRKEHVRVRVLLSAQRRAVETALSA